MSKDILTSEYFCDVSEEVFTDFYNYEPDFDEKLKPAGFVDDLSLRTANYTPYDLFCFNTKFIQKLQTFEDGLDYSQFLHCLEMKPYKGKQVMCVTLRRGSQVVPITLKMKKTMDVWAKECMTEMKGKCLLFSSNSDFWMGDVCIPTYWTNSVTKYIDVPREFNYSGKYLIDSEYEIEEEKIYIKLNPNTNYKKLYNELRLRILNELKDMYLNGSIATQNKKFIKDWKMSCVSGDLYQAEWTHMLVQKHKTLFLMNCERGVGLVRVGDDVHEVRTFQELVELGRKE